MNEAIGGKDDGAAQAVGLARKVGDLAAGFLYKQNSRKAMAASLLPAVASIQPTLRPAIPTRPASR